MSYYLQEYEQLMQDIGKYQKAIQQNLQQAESKLKEYEQCGATSPMMIKGGEVAAYRSVLELLDGFVLIKG